MVFSSTAFLFAFLPIVLALYFALRSDGSRNSLLLIASLFFYAWGETFYVLLLLASIGLNFGFGIWIESTHGRSIRGWVVAAAVVLNLLPLAIFKYLDFAIWNANVVLSGLGVAEFEPRGLHFPVGISFFTFQAISYVIDVQRRASPAERDPFRLALYLSVFPQLVVGPIVRYRSVMHQLGKRAATPDDIVEGIRRFVIGLAKKVLIANVLVGPVDRIFALPVSELRPEVAWLGVVAFALQIYFDFSGYTDMAVGLGRIFGFRFPENFDHPYAASSIRDFWQRWHISLSTWLRDYLYFALLSLFRNRRNGATVGASLALTMLLGGLWHGAAWQFVIWGGIHGGFLALERGFVGRLLDRAPVVLRHVYSLSVILVGWVFFRSESLAGAGRHLHSMFLGGSAGTIAPTLASFLDPHVDIVLAIAIIACLPWWPMLRARFFARGSETPIRRTTIGLTLGLALHGLLLLACAMSLAAGTHDPFIYFRF